MMVKCTIMALVNKEVSLFFVACFVTTLAMTGTTYCCSILFIEFS